jgi:protein SCO1/2
LGQTSTTFLGNIRYEQVPGFQLTDQFGEKISEQRFKNKIQVVDFFFTKCSTICPVMTTHLKDVQKHFQNEDKVAIISYSIDTKNDTPEELQSYAEHYNINPKQWSLVTGNQEEIFELAKGFKVRAFDDSYQEENSLIHDGTFVLIDTQRRVRGYYNGLDKQDTQRLIKDIEKLVKTL